MGKRPATYVDVEALPENVQGELIAGELHTHPWRTIPQARVITQLGFALSDSFDLGRNVPGSWFIFSHAPELHLGGDVLVPDLVGLRRERFPQLPRTAGLTLAPDWVCEVLCPSTEAYDRAIKLPVYAREKVQHVWLVDPDVRTLEVFRLEGTHYMLLATYIDDARVRAEPFEVLEVGLRSLWRA